MLPRNLRQEALSLAYIRAIAAQAGLGCSVREQDFGVDLSVHDIGGEGDQLRDWGFILDIQAKSTTASHLTDSHLVYDLKATNYADLIRTAVGCPRVLVVLVLPEEENAWTAQSEDCLILRRCAYWLSLRGLPPVANRQSVRLQIPRTNIFTAMLTAIFAKIRIGEALS